MSVASNFIVAGNIIDNYAIDVSGFERENCGKLYTNMVVC